MQDSEEFPQWPRRQTPGSTLNLIRLQRHRIEDAGIGHEFAEAMSEPRPGGWVTVREHHAARAGLHGELRQFLAIGVSAHLETFNARFDFHLHVDGIEKEIVTRTGREQLTAWGVRIAVTDKRDRVP